MGKIGVHGTTLIMFYGAFKDLSLNSRAKMAKFS